MPPRGRAIQYEADFTYANAMTLGEANGFVLGPGAFASPLETASTIAQELFRLGSRTLSERLAVGVCRLQFGKLRRVQNGLRLPNNRTFTRTELGYTSGGCEIW